MAGNYSGYSLNSVTVCCLLLAMARYRLGRWREETDPMIVVVT